MAEPLHPVMDDFVFGGIEADEQRLLATERAARSGVRHFHAIEPLDPLPGQPVRITVQTGPEIFVDRVTAYVTFDGSFPEGNQGKATRGLALPLQPMEVRWEPLLWDYVTLWQGEIPAQPAGTLVQYRIEAWRTASPPCSVWSSEINLDRTPETPTLYGYHVDTLTAPDWAREAVIYHILVDRFAGGEHRWLAPEEMERFTGGSLRGVIERLDYIADLGVTAIWLSPVFVCESYHGYDPIDFFNVDPRFGTNADLLELFAQAHARGLRVLLDFVANHTGANFPPFQQALRDPASPYRRWFTFDPMYKHGYRTFFDVAGMPQLNTDEPAVRTFLCSAAQHWLAAGADGFRLDYAAGPSHVFWSHFRAACRQVKADCWLFGEVTRTGALLRTYTGRLDGCLDFAFCRAVRKLCASAAREMSPSRFANQLQASRAFFRRDFLRPAFIDNHDMNRFLWLAGDDKRRLRLALDLLFGLGEAPCLYYGTEVGLSQPRPKGPWREEARHPMVWGAAQDVSLLSHTKQRIRLRRAHPALVDGEVITHVLDDESGVWLVERRSADDRMLLAFNFSEQQRTVAPPSGWVESMRAPRLRTIHLEPLSSRWIVLE